MLRQVDKQVAIKSHLIATIIEDTGIEEEIPLPNVKQSVLKKVMQYCEMHKNDDPPEIEKPLRSDKLYLFEPSVDRTWWIPRTTSS